MCVCNFVSSCHRQGKSRPQFTCCIVDEATQSQEVETLIPLMLGVKTLVLVGDAKQLPATVLSKVSKIPENHFFICFIYT
jgi:senataxin